MSKLDNISFEDYSKIYFLGIGGIGMSALAKFFLSEGKTVMGYDKTPSAITDELIRLGAKIHFENQSIQLNELLSPKDTLVIRTPAIPQNFEEYHFFLTNNFDLFKRSEILGVLTRNYKGLGVAGTHGKTTTSTLLTHIINTSHLHCNAFLGGISSNFNSNFLNDPQAEFTVIEADEFDRSFLQLRPFASIVTSTDADHLDVYETIENFQQGFSDYANLIHPEGVLVLREGISLKTKAKTITYGVESPSADYSAHALRYEEGRFSFDVSGSSIHWKNVELGIPGIHNAENALACIALCTRLGLSEEEIRHGLSTFKGVKRRFEYHIKENDFVYIDDYAHHPTEIKALLDSIQLLYPDKKITGIFQPHLFSRTRDFFADFATQLSRLDEVILLPIYPAREEPIPNITSEALLDKITVSNKHIFDFQTIDKHLETIDNCVLLTIGAGSIDQLIPIIKKGKTKE